MNGVHDMGGMTCFGPVGAEENEPVFHADWERRVFALSAASGRLFGPIDARRHALELQDPARYLASSYYERWLERLVSAATALGLLSEDEIATGAAHDAPPPPEPPPGPDFFAAIVRDGVAASRETGRTRPRFHPGDRVRARNLNPEGHTRLPRYVRGRLGVVERYHGVHVFPDTNAHGRGENPQPLYSVAFAAEELWGPEAAPHDRIYVDLWEDYLEEGEAGA